MKRFAFLPVLLLLVGTSARAEEVGLLAQCERWSGGVYAEEEPTQWNKNGHGVEFKYFKGQDPEPGWVGLPFYRYEEDERIDNPHDDPVGWSAWIPVRGLFDGEVNSIVYTTGAVWLLAVEKGRLTGRELKLPVVKDRETQLPKSLVPDGERNLVLYCLRSQ